MKNIFNKYLDTLYKYFKWLGVENEGLKRIFLLIYSFITFFIIWGFVGGLWNYLIGDIRERDDYFEIFIEFSFFLFMISITIKTLNWIIDGFKK